MYFMKKILSHVFVAAFCMLNTMPAMAQINLKKAVGGAAKAVSSNFNRCRRGKLRQGVH